MTGENFKRLNRHDDHLGKMLVDLETLRDQWNREYHKQGDDGNFIFDDATLDKITEKIERLKNCLYTYVYNRNTLEYTREFAKKYLW